MRIRAYVALSVVFCLPPVARAAEIVTVASPDGSVQFRLAAGAGGGLEYTVAFKQKPVIEISSIGIKVDGVNLGENVEAGSIGRYKVNETYPWNGNHSTAIDNCNGARITLTVSSGLAVGHACHKRPLWRRGTPGRAGARRAQAAAHSQVP